MKKVFPKIFSEIKWSRATVYPSLIGIDKIPIDLRHDFHYNVFREFERTIRTEILSIIKQFLRK